MVVALWGRIKGQYLRQLGVVNDCYLVVRHEALHCFAKLSRTNLFDGPAPYRIHVAGTRFFPFRHGVERGPV